MTTNPSAPDQFIAFQGERCIARGNLAEVVLASNALLRRDVLASVLVFNAINSELVELDPRGGTPSQTGKAAGPGRPKLGVVAREVTLLPRHWDWLNAQPGGASVALRKLVELARRDNHAKDQERKAQEACYRFMSAIAGDRVGFEEAARALFAADRLQLQAVVAAWPADIRQHLLQLAEPAFERAWDAGKPHA